MTIIKPIALLIAWVVALYGVLQIHFLPGNWGHGICGPWGCGPPTQSLVSCHAFWFVFVAGPVGFAIRSWSSATLLRVGIALTAVGALGLLAIGVHDIFTWLPTVSESIQRYSIQRYLFRVVTLIDIPVIPLLVAGTVVWSVGRRRLFVALGTLFVEASAQMRTNETDGLSASEHAGAARIPDREEAAASIAW